MRHKLAVLIRFDKDLHVILFFDLQRCQLVESLLLHNLILRLLLCRNLLLTRPPLHALRPSHCRWRRGCLLLLHLVNFDLHEIDANVPDLHGAVLMHSDHQLVDCEVLNEGLLLMVPID